MSGVVDFLRSYLEGQLQQKYGLDFRSKMAASALEPERIQTGIEAQKAGTEATRTGIETQKLEQQKILDELNTLKDKARVLKEHGVISPEAEDFLVRQAHGKAQAKLLEAQTAESGARAGEHKNRARLLGEQAGYFSRRPGTPAQPVTRARQVPGQILDEIRAKATEDLTRGTSPLSRINWGNLVKGPFASGPIIEPLRPEQNPDTLEFARARGKRVKERVEAEGFNPQALGEVSHQVGAPGPGQPGLGQPGQPSAPGSAQGAAPDIRFDPHTNGYYMVIGGRAIPISPDAVEMTGAPPIPDGYDPEQ